MVAILNLLLKKQTHISDGQPSGIQSQRSQLTFSNLIKSSTLFVNSLLRADPGLQKYIFKKKKLYYIWKENYLKFSNTSSNKVFIFQVEAILYLLLKKLTHISDGQPGGIQSQRSQLTYSNLITSSTHFVNSLLRADPGLQKIYI